MVQAKVGIALSRYSKNGPVSAIKEAHRSTYTQVYSQAIEDLLHPLVPEEKHGDHR